MKLSEFIHERMIENKKMFSEKEWNIVKENKELVKKIYMVGVINRNDVNKE